MKVYILDNVDSFLGFMNDDDSKLCLSSFVGKPMKTQWDSSVTIEEYNSRSKKYDISRLCLNPVLSEKAVSALGDLLEGKAEILPYRHKTEKYYALNVMKVIDCIDFAKSACVIEQNKYVKEINRYAFKEKLIYNEPIFKIPQFVTAPIYVTDSFRERVIASELTGFIFREVWDSEESTLMEVPQENKAKQGNKAYDFNKAVDMVEKGKTLVSENWVLQKNNNTFYIGRRENNGEYSWIDPIFIPPILLELQWYTAEKIEFSE